MNDHVYVVKLPRGEKVVNISKLKRYRACSKFSLSQHAREKNTKTEVTTDKRQVTPDQGPEIQVKVTSAPDLRVPRSTDQEREVEEAHDDREPHLDLSNNVNEEAHVASDVQQPLPPRRTQRRRIRTTPIQIDPSGSHYNSLRI